MTTASEPQTPAAQLDDFVGRRAARLQQGYLRDDAGAVAQLAQLRHTLGRPLGSEPISWEILDDLPTNLLGRGDEPSCAEAAAHLALGLFALHQQSKRAKGMHQAGWKHGLGASLRQLSGGAADPDAAITRRFVALGTSQNLQHSATHLRGLVTQLRGNEIPLDYGRLAADLYLIQHPQQATGVRIRWGRDYYTRPQQNTDPDTAEQSQPGDDA